MPAVQAFSFVQLLCPVSCLADEAYIASEVVTGRCAPDLASAFSAGLGLAGLESIRFEAMGVEPQKWRALDMMSKCWARFLGLLSRCDSSLGSIKGAILTNVLAFRTLTCQTALVWGGRCASCNRF